MLLVFDVMLLVGFYVGYISVAQDILMERYGLSENEADFFLQVPEMMLIFVLPLCALLIQKTGYRGSFSVVTGAILVCGLFGLLLSDNVNVVYFFIIGAMLARLTFHIVHLGLASVLLPMSVISTAVCLVNCAANIGRVLIPPMIGRAL